MNTHFLSRFWLKQNVFVRRSHKTTTTTTTTKNIKKRKKDKKHKYQWVLIFSQVFHSKMTKTIHTYNNSQTKPITAVKQWKMKM